VSTVPGVARVRHPSLPGAALALATAALLAPSFRAAGSPFDEGILVTFPTRILAGAIPYRDFETFYGPGEPYLVAGLFRAFGAGLVDERAVGFVFRLLLVLGLFALLRRFGEVPALAGGVVAACLVAPEGLSANTHVAALALSVLALVALERAGGAPRLLLAGLVAGAAALFSTEFVVLAPLAALPLVLRSGRRGVWFGVGVVVALLPYVPLAVASGSRRIDKNVHDLLATGRDRRLPITLGSESGRLLVVLFAGLALLAVATALVAPRGVLGSLFVLALSQAPYALWRADVEHVALASVVALAAAPATAALVARRRHSAAALGAAAAILAVFASVHYVRGGVSLEARLALGRAPVHVVSYGGRTFRIASETDAHDLQQAIAAEARLARRGSALFVGPRDLRRTAGNDAFVYYLLPHQRPASFYVELDPVASRAGSGLPNDLRHADLLLLGGPWDALREPNASSHEGPPTANRIVARLFCRRGRFGTYELLARCR
jgi:hypothetical protein